MSVEIFLAEGTKPPGWEEDDSAEKSTCIGPVSDTAIVSQPSSSVPVKRHVGAQHRDPCKGWLQLSDQMQELSCMLFELQLQFQISRDSVFLPDADRLRQQHIQDAASATSLLCTRGKDLLNEMGRMQANPLPIVCNL